jgi:hypothetical protein
MAYPSSLTRGINVNSRMPRMAQVPVFVQEMRLSHLSYILGRIPDELSTAVEDHPLYNRVNVLYNNIFADIFKTINIDTVALNNMEGHLEASHIHFLCGDLALSKLELSQAVNVAYMTTLGIRLMIKRLSVDDADGDALGLLDVVPALVKEEITKRIRLFV